MYTGTVCASRPEARILTNVMHGVGHVHGGQHDGSTGISTLRNPFPLITVDDDEVPRDIASVSAIAKLDK